MVKQGTALAGGRGVLERRSSSCRINPTTPLYLALCLTPLPMREIGAVIAPLPPGDEHEDLVNAIPPQG